MHVLDDLDGFTPRARGFLRRTGRKEGGQRLSGPAGQMRVRESSGRLIPAPLDLVIRREGFAHKFGGLRYEVRRSVLLHGVRHEVTRLWDFDLEDRIWPDGRGWCFDWVGEHVSSPVRFLAHTDGRIGVSDGGPFLEIASSVMQLIESHAVMDAVASWDPLPTSLEPWVPARSGLDLADRIEGLTVVPEASGRFDRWLLSGSVAVREFWTWTSQRPRTRAVMIWAHGAEGRQQIARLPAQ